MTSVLVANRPDLGLDKGSDRKKLVRALIRDAQQRANLPHGQTLVSQLLGGTAVAANGLSSRLLLGRSGRFRPR